MKRSSEKSKLELLTKEAEEKAPETQPWPTQFKLKSQELALLFGFLNIGKIGRMLEIGCGNAFNSALFSDKADKIVATDLPDYNLSTSSIGLDYAQRLVEALGIDNIALLACPAEELPFADDSFDLVFSSYVLEHVSNKKKAVSEIKRVLKKGGICIAFVPNFMERLYAPFYFYPYLFKRGIVYLLRLLGFSFRSPNATVIANKESGEGTPSLPFLKRIKKFKKDYPRFPFCMPHGNYKCWREELVNHLPMRWKSLFERTGMRIVDIYSTMFIPHNFLTVFSEHTAYFVYSKSISLTKKIARNPILKYLGYSLCLVVQK